MERELAFPSGFDKILFVLVFSTPPAEVAVENGVKKTHNVFTFREPGATFKNLICVFVAKKQRGECVLDLSLLRPARGRPTL